MIFDLLQREDRLARATLTDFISQVRASLDRDLPVTAEDVLAGLEYALAEKRPGQPIDFRLGNEELDRRARARLECIRSGRLRVRALEDRRFGQPHFGHKE